MAGADPTGSFSEASFRSNIKLVMKMASPNTVEPTTFRWVVEQTYATADPAGSPYDWTESPASHATPITITDLAVDCAVQFGGDASSTTEAGEIDQLSAVITMLDVDQEALVAHGGRMPDQVLLKGLVYNVDFIPAPVALFSVDVFTIYCSTEDAQG
jgi:hypothetical protein